MIIFKAGREKSLPAFSLYSCNQISFYLYNNEEGRLKNMRKRKDLSSLSVGEVGIVDSLICRAVIRRRFLDIGLIPGTEVFCYSESPLGDPKAYVIRGKVMAIRKEDAESILLI